MSIPKFSIKELPQWKHLASNAIDFLQNLLPRDIVFKKCEILLCKTRILAYIDEKTRA